MPDLENVIKGLQEAVDWLSTETSLTIVDQWVVRDALSLLKAQEPVKPVFDAGDGKTIGQFLCGKCHAKIGFGHPHFCWYCGRAVKWE